jgi:hypothetical protein
MAAPAGDMATASATPDRLGAHYAAGPMLSLSGEEKTRGPEMDGAMSGEMGEEIEREKAEEATAPTSETEAATEAIATGNTEQRLPFDTLHSSGQGEAAHDVAFNTSLRLEGRTDATFDGGNFHTERVRVSAATGCQGCSTDNPCIRARGTLVATYAVTTTVTLPSAANFPNLRPCQRQRVQAAIDNILVPHEQEHVTAFNTYNGTTRRAFDLTLCRNDFDAAIQAMFDTEAASRQSAAQAASDALDPFHFDVNIDCEDQPARRSTLGPEISGLADQPEEVV